MQSRFLIALALSLITTPIMAQTCPALPDRSAERAELMTAVRDAPNYTANREAVDRLWKHWRKAPDEKAQALLDLGIRRRDEFSFKAAEAALNELVAYCPEYSEGWNQRAFVYFLTKDYGRALQDLEKALEITPDHIAAMAGMVLTLTKLGRNRVAQKILREALALNPYLPEKSLLVEPKGKDI